jgi:hypothetical protein
MTVAIADESAVHTIAVLPDTNQINQRDQEAVRHSGDGQKFAPMVDLVQPVRDRFLLGNKLGFCVSNVYDIELPA